MRTIKVDDLQSVWTVSQLPRMSPTISIFNFVNIFLVISMANSSSRSASPLEFRAKVGDSSRGLQPELFVAVVRQPRRLNNLPVRHWRYKFFPPHVISYQICGQGRLYFRSCFVLCSYGNCNSRVFATVKWRVPYVSASLHDA